ncbi:MAG: hypothetical protein AMXMBFR44_5550 [Candidatus Campbellbacteria bacterium]
MQLSDFNKWNKIKKNISLRSHFPRCKEREIWWCSIGRNVGAEQSCRNNVFARPVLILKIFNQNTFWGLPITSSDTDGKKALSPYYYDVRGVPKLKGYVVLSQLRLFDNKRLIRKIVRIEDGMMNEIKDRVRGFL